MTVQVTVNTFRASYLVIDLPEDFSPATLTTR
jgi:hypothetical protein